MCLRLKLSPGTVAQKHVFHISNQGLASFDPSDVLASVTPVSLTSLTNGGGLSPK